MKANVKFEVSDSHIELFERSNWRYAFLMGGRGNGRSGTASRYCVSHLFGKEYTRAALVRAVHADIEKSCWAEVYSRILEQGVLEAEGLRIVPGDMTATYGNNSLSSLGFKSSAGSLTARLKSLADFNLAWIEEAEETGETEVQKLDESLRTTKGRNHIVFTLNTPPKTHWLIKRFFDLEPHPEASGFYIPHLKAEYGTDAIYIPGTYRDNLPNIDPATARLYEKYKETNPAHYWQVIEGLCPETVQGRIYSGWKVVESVPHEARLLGYALDFGFDPDPAAIVAIYWYNGGYILHEILYQTELLNDHLAATLKGLPKAPIIADSAEPKSIEDLKRYGLNVIPCEKKPDSVNWGIKHVQSLRISYTRSSRNLANEYENYAWKINKDGDQVGIEDPKCANHLMSAARYGLTMFAGEDSMYDPEQRDRARMRSEETRRNVISTAREDAGL